MAEYNPRMDEDKTIPVLPRPVTSVDHKIRALNLTGDATGMMPTDDHMFWQGLDRRTMLNYEAQDLARLERDKAIDQLWG